MERKKILITIIIIFIFFIAMVSLFSSKKNTTYNHPDKPPEGITLENETTVLKSSPTEGYTVTYIGTSNGIKSLKISNSDPSSRISAINWIKAQGYDLTNTKLIFSDYNNPFNKQDVQSDN